MSGKVGMRRKVREVLPVVAEPVDPVLIDRGRVRQLLRVMDGNVTRVSEEIGVDSLRLRRFVRGTRELMDEIDEVLDRAVDASVDVLFEGVRDGENYLKRFGAAKEFLRSDGGRKRGFGVREGSVEIKARRGGTLVLKWMDTDGAKEPLTIEGDKGE